MPNDKHELTKKNIVIGLKEKTLLLSAHWSGRIIGNDYRVVRLITGQAAWSVEALPACRRHPDLVWISKPSSDT